MSARRNLIIDEALLARRLREVAERKKEIAQEKVFASGDVFAAAAEDHAPENTGALKLSVSKENFVDDNGPGVEVGAGEESGDVDYALYQEFGSSRNPPHPYIRPALKAAVSHLRASVK